MLLDTATGSRRVEIWEIVLKALREELNLDQVHICPEYFVTGLSGEVE